jgi:hypothetical protein
MCEWVRGRPKASPSPLTHLISDWQQKTRVERAFLEFLHFGGSQGRRHT